MLVLSLQAEIRDRTISLFSNRHLRSNITNNINGPILSDISYHYNFRIHISDDFQKVKYRAIIMDGPTCRRRSPQEMQQLFMKRNHSISPAAKFHVASLGGRQG